METPYQIKQAAGGRIKCAVVDADTGLEIEELSNRPWDLNLVTDYGLDYAAAYGHIRDLLANCHISQEETPTSIAITGTYSQSGTTLTRVSGSRDFEDAAFQQRVLDLNPVAYYPLTEASGSTIEDLGPDGYDGTVVNPTAMTYRHATPAVAVEKGAMFTYKASTQSMVNIGHAGALEFVPNADPFSVSFWLAVGNYYQYGDETLISKTGNGAYYTSAAHFRVVLNAWHSAYGGPGIKIQVGGTPVIFAQEFSEGGFHHIAISSDGTTSSVYIDGVLAGTITNGSTQESAVDWRIGGTGSGDATNNNANTRMSEVGTSAAQKSLCHVAFFDYALSAAEVLALCDQTNGDVGRTFKLASGEEGKILAVTSATTATVDVSRTAAASNMKLWNTGINKVLAPYKVSNSYPQYTYSDGRPARTTIYNLTTGITTLRCTYDFTPESGSVTIKTVAVSNATQKGSILGAIVNIAGAPVALIAGQQIRVTYELDVQVGGLTAADQAVVSTPVSATGWPNVYGISAIVNGGSSFTVTTAVPHHFAATGTRKVNIAGSSAHFNGEWTISSVADNTHFTITATVVGADAGAGGTVYNNLKFSGYKIGAGVRQVADSGYGSGANAFGTAGYGTDQFGQWPGYQFSLTLFAGNSLATWSTGLVTFDFSYGGATSYYSSGAGVIIASTWTYSSNNAVLGTYSTYVPGSFKRTLTFYFSPSVGNNDAFRGMVLGNGGQYAWYVWTFQEPQSKKATHGLTIVVEHQTGRVLPATP